jgi:NADPH:quinone reductase-like Zn-dependent oxidoreductase
MSERTMLAIRFHEYGGPEKLVLERVPVPVPKDGEVLIKVHATAVNPYDWKVRTGIYKGYSVTAFPVIPGAEASGIIESVGPGVETLKPGQNVYGIMYNASAEYTVADEKMLYLKPRHMSHAEAATITIASQTAWAAVIDIAKLQPHQRILIHGAAGSVGLAAVRLAHWKKAYVMATAATQNIEFVSRMGADEVIDYTKHHFENRVHDADIVIDTIGGETQERSWQVLRKGGILVALVAAPPPGMAEKYGVTAAYRSGGTSEEGLRKIPDLVEQGILLPLVRKVFPLSEAGEAQLLSEQGHGRGKVVLEIVKD